MGYLDGLTAGFFKRDAQGREVFFPAGKFGKGRIVPSDRDAATVRRYIKIYNVALIAGVVPAGLVAGQSFQTQWMITLLAYGCLAIAGFMPLWQRVRAWHVSSERLTYRESIAASARAHSRRSLGILIAIGVVLIVGNLAVLAYTDDVAFDVFSLFGVLFFGTCVGIFAWMLRARRRV